MPENPSPSPSEDLPDRILVVNAHPDDVDFSASGSVARWTAAGARVGYCIATDGDAGGFDPSVDRADIPGIRQREQRDAAALVGVSDLWFLGFPDGRLACDLDLRREIARVIREFRPGRVLCPNPGRNFASFPASHPDHMAAGEAALCAVYPDARNPFAFPELAEAGLEAHVVDEVWVVGHPDADTFVDITDTFEQKIAAIRAHVSQHPDSGRLDGFVREWSERIAKNGGLATGRLAESFLVCPSR